MERSLPGTNAVRAWFADAGTEVMRDQFQHLLTVSCRRIRIRSPPLRPHEGIDGAFAIGNASSGDKTTDRLENKRLTGLYASIQSTAYPVDQSLELIAKVAQEKWT